MKISPKILVIALLVLASGSQFLKQAWLAGVFRPEIYAGWATAILASQLLYNFGGLGYHNFSARHAALYESRQKKFLINRLVSRQYIIYAYLLPISIPVVYYFLAKPSFMLFGFMLVYSLANIFLNISTVPIYVRSSREFSTIQALRGSVGGALAIVTCYATGSLLFTLLSESLWMFVLGIAILKKRKFKFKKKFLKLDLNWKQWKQLIPFFLPVVLATIAITLSRLVAINVLNDDLLGVYYFMFLIASVGALFQYGLSVFIGPIITSQLNISSELAIENLVVKIWMGIFLLSTLVFALGHISLPYLIYYFYPSYIPGLVLASSLLFLCAAKMCDIWSIYFLLGGLEKYLHLPHLVSIIVAAFMYYFVVGSKNFELIDMRFFILGEAFSIFFVPLLSLLFINRRRLFSI